MAPVKESECEKLSQQFSQHASGIAGVISDGERVQKECLRT
jgi:hypothetical protein